MVDPASVPRRNFPTTIPPLPHGLSWGRLGFFFPYQSRTAPLPTLKKTPTLLRLRGHVIGPKKWEVLGKIDHNCLSP